MKIDKILQDLPLFTVLLSRALAGSRMCRWNENPMTLFAASSTDYHPCYKKSLYFYPVLFEPCYEKKNLSSGFPTRSDTNQVDLAATEVDSGRRGNLLFL